MFVLVFWRADAFLKSPASVEFVARPFLAAGWKGEELPPKVVSSSAPQLLFLSARVADSN